MNIGFDAYYLYNRQYTGIGTVVLQLIKGLSEKDSRNRYFFFTPGIVHDELEEELRRHPNVEIVIVKGCFFSFRRAWLQSPSLLRAIVGCRIDFFFGGGEYIPVLLPPQMRTGVIIHDCSFRLFPETLTLVSKLLYSTLFRLSLRRADYIFTISNDSEKDIRRFYSIGTKPVIVIPNGIDLSIYSPSGKKAADPFILFVGTLQPRKNLLNLIKGFVAASGSIDARLVVVGESGRKGSAVVLYLNSLPPDIRARIEFKGYVQREELYSLYRDAVLFAAPSFHEGFGLIILEAMSSGTPVLTSPVGAIPEFFSGSVEFADPHSPEDIGSRIVSLLGSPSRLKALSKKGLALSRVFSVEGMIKGYLDAFNRIATDIENKAK